MLSIVFHNKSGWFSFLREELRVGVVDVCVMTTS